MKTASIVVKNQIKHYGPRFFTEHGRHYRITAHVRYDDQCGNGHNTFSITADVDEKTQNGYWVVSAGAGGCCHEEVAKHFPELAPFIKWHLVSADGPTHYIDNTIYHAGDLDYRGLRAGEKRQLVSGRSMLPVWQCVVRNERGEEVSIGSQSWVASKHKPLQKLTADFEPVWVVGEGKERELDFARASAVWPEATDAQLCQSPEILKKELLARLPALIDEFRRAVESLGFTF